MMEYNTVILNTIAHICECVFIYSQYRGKSEKKRIIIGMFVLFFLLVVPEFLPLPDWLDIVKVACQAFFMVAVSMLVLKGFDKSILIVDFSGAVFALPGNIIGSIMFLYIPENFNFLLRIFLVLLVSIAIHTLVMVIAIVYVGRRLEKVYMDDKFPWVALFLVPLMTYCSIYTLRTFPQNFADNPWNMVSAVFVSMLCISAYFLALRTMDYQKNNTSLYYTNQEYEIMIQQMKNRVETANQKEKDASILRHDERHVINLIHQLIEDEEYEMALSVLETHAETIEGTAVRTFCKNVVVNSVLEFAVRAAEKKSVSINIQADIPEYLPVRDMEFAMVVANLLENAINAASKCKNDPKVSFIAMRKGDKYIFEFSNTYIGELKFDDKYHIPLSDKGEGHGLGMQSVLMFAEKNDAIFDCGDENGMFVVRILLTEKNAGKA